MIARFMFFYKPGVTKTAFAIYLFHILVGPHDYNGDNSANFILALKDIDHFAEFNWAEYIFDEISIDVLNARCARKAKKEFLPSFGSALLLNVSSLKLFFRIFFFPVDGGTSSFANRLCSS